MTLKLDRPLAVIDLETTGTDVETARIVQIGYLILVDGGFAEHRETLLINPGIPIPAEASAIHGITDAMVAQAPTFDELAGAILEDLAECDLAGFNIEKFDLPLLKAEFLRAGYVGFGADRRVVDAMRICHQREKRDLGWASRFYLGRDHSDGHDALADAAVTAEILVEQVRRYGLPQDAAGLEAACHERPPEWVDPDGKLRWQGTEAVFAFGKMAGKTLRDVVAKDRGFLEWMLGKDFSPELKTIVGEAIKGWFPVRTTGERA